MSETQLLDLLDLIYRFATDNDCVNTLANQLANMFDGSSCLIRYCHRISAVDLPSLAAILCATANFDARARTAYAEYYHEHNEWFRRGWPRGTPCVMLGQELIDMKSLQKTPWADFMRMTNIHHGIGAQYGITGDLLGVIGVYRDSGCDAFDESDRRKMALLLPHIQRAMQVREKLAVSENSGALTLDLLYRLSIAIVLVSADRRIIFSNHAADQLFRKGNGLSIVHGRLRPQQSDEAQTFERMVAEASKATQGDGKNPGGVMYLKLPLGKREPILIAPFVANSLDIKPAEPMAVVIFSGNSDDGIGDIKMAAHCYGLTPAETRLLAALVNGYELAEYAEATRVSIGTVRTHLKSLFAKTGCHRQVDVVSKVLSDPLFRLTSTQSINRDVNH